MNGLTWKMKMQIALALIGLLLLILAGCSNMSPAQERVIIEAEKEVIETTGEIIEEVIKEAMDDDESKR